MMVLRIIWVLWVPTLCGRWFLPFFALAVSFSLAYRLRVCSFPFSACVSSPAITLEFGCVVGLWMWIGYWFPHLLADIFPCLCWDFCFSPVLGLCNIAIVFIVSLGCRFTLFLGCFLVSEATDVFWGLFLSFFCHSRAKNNSRVWFDLNYVSPFVWGCHPVVFAFFTEMWAVCFTAACSGWSLDYWE